MKRLTDKTDYVLGTYSDMEERLMDIEDILGDDYDLDRLRALTKADRKKESGKKKASGGAARLRRVKIENTIRDQAGSNLDCTRVRHAQAKL